MPPGTNANALEEALQARIAVIQIDPLRYRYARSRDSRAPSRSGARGKAHLHPEMPEKWTQSSAWLAAGGIGRGPNMCWQDAGKYAATSDGKVRSDTFTLATGITISRVVA